MHGDSRNGGQDGEDAGDDADFDPKEYGAMIVLERLESLEEDMVDLSVSTLDEVRARIAELHRALDGE
jgi:hypothetical protein